MGIQDWASRRWAARSSDVVRPETVELAGQTLVFSEVVAELDRSRDVLLRLLQLGRVPDGEQAVAEFEAAAGLFGVFMGRSSGLD